MAAFNPRQLNPPRYRNEDEIGLGTLISLTGGTGITVTPDPIVETGVIALESLGVDPSGTYGDANNVSQITVDAQGRVTAAADVPIVSGIVVQDEGTPLATSATTLNFTGTGVTASGTGATKTINIPLSSTVVMDNTATGNKYPTAPNTEGCWYGTGTKFNSVASSVVIGNSASGNGGSNAVAIGTSATTSNHTAAVAIGTLATVAQNDCIAIGYDALGGFIGGGSSVAIGRDTFAWESDVAIGFNALAESRRGVAVGRDTITRQDGVSIGYGAIATAGSNGSVLIGSGSSATAANGCAVGFSSVCDVTNGIAIGQGANTLSTAFPVAIVTNAAGIDATAPTGAVTYLGVTVNGVAYKLLLQVP